jgi:hypothetical protein
MRKNPTIRKFSKKRRKEKKRVQTLPSRRTALVFGQRKSLDGISG